MAHALPSVCIACTEHISSPYSIIKLYPGHIYPVNRVLCEKGSPGRAKSDNRFLYSQTHKHLSYSQIILPSSKSTFIASTCFRLETSLVFFEYLILPLIDALRNP